MYGVYGLNREGYTELFSVYDSYEKAIEAANIANDLTRHIKSCIDKAEEYALEHCNTDAFDLNTFCSILDIPREFVKEVRTRYNNVQVIIDYTKDIDNISELKANMPNLRLDNYEVYEVNTNLTGETLLTDFTQYEM